MHREVNASFVAETVLNKHFPAFKNKLIDKHELSNILNLATHNIDSLISKNHQQAPDTVLVGIMEAMSHHTSMIAEALRAQTVDRQAHINSAKSASKKALSDLLFASFAQKGDYIDFLSEQLFTLFDYYSRLILRSLTGQVIWDKKAWEYLRPYPKQMH